MRLFDCLQFDGASWQVVAQEGTALSLKNLTTARIRSVDIADLLGDESYLPECNERLPDLSQSAILETLDPDTRQRTTALHRHVVEVLTGVPPVDHDDGDNGSIDPKPQFDPKNRLGERVAAKVEELRLPSTDRTQDVSGHRPKCSGIVRATGDPCASSAIYLGTGLFGAHCYSHATPTERDQYRAHHETVNTRQAQSHEDLLELQRNIGERIAADWLSIRDKHLHWVDGIVSVP